MVSLMCSCLPRDDTHSNAMSSAVSVVERYVCVCLSVSQFVCLRFISLGRPELPGTVVPEGLIFYS